MTARFPRCEMRHRIAGAEMVWFFDVMAAGHGLVGAYKYGIGETEAAIYYVLFAILFAIVNRKL